MMNNREKFPKRDRISWLPQNLLDIILVSLPLEEAVRTSLLSREWRRKWVSIPHLVFDSKLVTKTSVVYHVLLHHHGTITKFHLDITRLEQDDLAMSDWIELVSKSCLEDFTLDSPLYDDQPYKLPCCFFSCQNLRHLELHLCALHPPLSFRGFTHLVRLVLENVEIASDVLGSLLCKCSFLESLTLKGFDKTNLEFNAPKLKFLHIHGTISRISFTAPTLVTLSLAVHMNGNRDNHLQEGLEIRGSATMLENFSSNSGVEAIGSMLKASPLCLGQVKFIELHDLIFVDDLEDALSLLRGSPNLQKLIVQEFLHEEDGDEEIIREEVRQCYDKESSKEIFLRLLRYIEITTEFAHGSQEFIKFLLERSPALQTIHIRVPPVDPGSKRLAAVKDSLLSYPRASLTAEVYVSPAELDPDAS